MSNWANQSAYLTGMQGQHVDEQIKGVNGFSDMHGTFNKYGNAYRGGMTGSTHLASPDYTNPNNLLHNNLNDNVMDVETLPTKLFINSFYKDYEKHPEPYNFVVKFNSITPTIEPVKVMIDNKEFSYPKYVDGERCVSIDRAFKNINHITVDIMIPPIYIDYETNSDGIFEPSGLRFAERYRYVLLKIPELRNCRKFSNAGHMGDDAFIMKVEQDMGVNNQCWLPIHNTISYFSSKLKNLDRLSIRLCDDKGNQLCTTLDGENYDFYKEYRRLIDKAMSLKKKNDAKSLERLESLVPKLECLKNIVEHVYIEIHFTMNILEPQLSTLPKFSNY